MARNRDLISMTFSKEVVRKLRMFRNKSRVVDDILSLLLADVSKDEILKLMIDDEDVAMYLIKRKCSELSNRGILVGVHVSEVETGKDATPQQTVKQTVDKKPKINPQDFWG